MFGFISRRRKMPRAPRPRHIGDQQHAGLPRYVYHKNGVQYRRIEGTNTYTPAWPSDDAPISWLHMYQLLSPADRSAYAHLAPSGMVQPTPPSNEERPATTPGGGTHNTSRDDSDSSSGDSGGD